MWGRGGGQAETCCEICDNGALLCCVYWMFVCVKERNDVGRRCVGQG